MRRLVEPAFAFPGQRAWMVEESQRTGREDVRPGGDDGDGKGYGDEVLGDLCQGGT